jgi:hypothetical protein
MRRFVLSGLIGALLAGTAPAGAEEEPARAAELAGERALRWGFEAKAHYRDSERLRFPSPFPFPADFLPPGAQQAFLETVNPGQHVEVSVLTLVLDARWSEGLVARARIDAIDLYDRNPTSTGREVDVDELWIRFGRDADEAGPGVGGYLLVGKFPAFERQDDRHLESYGLVATAFNRFPDIGVELGLDLGRNVYLRASATQGNPVFFRDPNALAGDNGTPDRDPGRGANPQPDLASGFPILYDAKAQDLDFDGDFELGVGLGLRFGEPGGTRELNLLAWARERDLADRVPLDGTFYGGDLDLLDGPFTGASLPISGRRKREVGANLWLYLGGFSFFGQYVDQEIAGMDRRGWEGEVAWRFELPLVRAVGGRQLFPSLQPALRYSRLEPEFVGGGPFPAPSVRWPWTKIDYGLRLGIVEGIDLTAEYQDNEMTLASGARLTYGELLATLRWRI